MYRKRHSKNKLSVTYLRSQLSAMGQKQVGNKVQLTRRYHAALKRAGNTTEATQTEGDSTERLVSQTGERKVENNAELVGRSHADLSIHGKRDSTDGVNAQLNKLFGGEKVQSITININNTCGGATGSQAPSIPVTQLTQSTPMNQANTVSSNQVGNLVNSANLEAMVNQANFGVNNTVSTNRVGNLVNSANLEAKANQPQVRKVVPSKKFPPVQTTPRVVVGEPKDDDDDNRNETKGQRLARKRLESLEKEMKQRKPLADNFKNTLGNLIESRIKATT